MSKKKILLMSDDLRMHSGVATVSKDIVMETLNEYDWVQIGGAIKHPEVGKVVDMSQGLKEFGIKDGYLRIYPVDGYGNEDILREVTPITENLKLVRLDKGTSGNTSVMLIVPDEDHSIETISNKLHALDNNIHITFFEAKTNW